MGFFKSAEEKEAEKRKKELVEKYGEEDGLRIFEKYNSEEKYLEEKEKKKKHAEIDEKAPQKVLDYFDKEDVGGSMIFHEAFFEDNVSKDYYEGGMTFELGNYYPATTNVSIESPENIVKEFIRLVKELIEEGKLFTADTWKGEALPDRIKEMTGHVFTKSYAEGFIEFNKESQKEDQKWKNLIIDLLTKKSIKMTISDITAHIKHDDRDYIKSILEEMHQDGKIDFGGSGRYFIYSEEKKEPKKAAPKTEEVDIEKELEKYKGLLDKGLIDKEDYEAKKDKLLGI